MNTDSTVHATNSELVRYADRLYLYLCAKCAQLSRQELSEEMLAGLGSCSARSIEGFELWTSTQIFGGDVTAFTATVDASYPCDRRAQTYLSGRHAMALQATGDGNCFFNSLSTLLFKSEERNRQLRVFAATVGTAMSHSWWRDRICSRMVVSFESFM